MLRGEVLVSSHAVRLKDQTLLALYQYPVLAESGALQQQLKSYMCPTVRIC